MTTKSFRHTRCAGATGRTIYYFDIVHDYPAMGGVVEFSQILFDQLKQHYGSKIVSVCERAVNLNCLHADMLYLDRERKLAEIFSVVDPNSVFFFPNFQSPIAKGPEGPSIINVIHDLQFALLPEFFSEGRRRWLHQTFAETKENADHVVFISRSTQQDYVRLFGKPRRQTVIYNPVETTRAPAPAVTSNDEDKPFLLASFHHHPHKNFPGLLAVFESLTEHLPELELIVTGHGRDHLETDLTILSASARARIRHLGYVPRDTLDDLYRRAQAFITLSRFEGFNMSAAEAACHGTPLILSDLPVHRELFGRQAYFVNLACSLQQSADKIATYLKGDRPRKQWPFRDACSPSRVCASYARIIDSLSA